MIITIYLLVSVKVQDSTGAKVVSICIGVMIPVGVQAKDCHDEGVVISLHEFMKMSLDQNKI